MLKITANPIKKILLTGASGTVGIETLKCLIQNPAYEITAFDVDTRETIKKLAPFSDTVKIVYGDITNASAVESVCKDKDIVIHLAAIIPPLADNNPELAYLVNVNGTENLIRGLEKSSPHCFFLFSSSISVYGDRIKNLNIIVSDPLKPSIGDRYGETKVLCEKLLQQSKLSWTIFRLAAIMGNHKLSKLMFHMPLDTALEICTPQDTGRAFANAVAYQNKLQNRIFNLGGGDECIILYSLFLEKMFEAFGLGKPYFPKKAFAEKNFHCGIFFDGDDLEEILHFRRQNLTDYFNMVNLRVNPYQKKIIYPFRALIQRWLLSQSEPYHAYRNNHVGKTAHFFNTESEIATSTTIHH